MDDTTADADSPWSTPSVRDRVDDPAEEAPVSQEKVGVRHATWRGAKTGFRYFSFVFGPIAAFAFVPGLVLMAIGFGVGPSLAVPELVVRGLGLYFVAAATGAVTGAVLGLTTALVGRCLPSSVRTRWRSRFNRPIRLFRNRESAGASNLTERRAKRFRLWLGVVGIPFAVLLIVSLGVGVYLRITVQRRLSAAIAAAQRDDPYWQIDDLMAHREPVPDEENSALVVAQALVLLPENWPFGPKQPNGGPPTTRTRAETLVQRFPATENNRRLDPDTVRNLRAELAANEDAVLVARTLAYYERGRHELILGPAVFDTLLPETQASRNAARLLCLDAELRAHDGDFDGAFESCHAIFGVARSIGDEPYLISGLVHTAIGMVGTRSAINVLGQGEPSMEVLDRFQRLLFDELNQPRLVICLRGERASLTEMIRRVGDGELPITALSDSTIPFAPEGTGQRPAPIIQLWFNNQRAVGLEMMNQLVAIAQLPAPEWPTRVKAWDAEFSRIRHNRILVMTAVLPLLLMPAQSASFKSEARYQAEIGATAILVAAERHRRKVGDWPASISAIDGEVLPNPPVDPWSGQPFRMLRGDGRIVIYSIGANGQDDHGEFDRKRANNGGPDDISATGWDASLRAQVEQ